MHRQLIKFFAASTLICTAASTSAAIITYDDRAAFIAATGAVDIGALPNNGGSAAINVGGFTIGGAAGSTPNTTQNWSTLISEANDLAINGTENFDFGSPGPIFALGFDFHEPDVQGAPSPDTCNAPCFDSTFNVTLLLGAVNVGSFSFNRPDASLQFVGVASSDAFDRVQVREAANNIDNEFFGNFLVSRQQQAVPEPGTLALLGAGLLGLAWRRRRA